MVHHLEPTPGSSESPGSPTGPQVQRTVADRAERAVQIAAAMTYVDQARHLLDGLHDTCHVCSSRVETVTVHDEVEWDGAPGDPDGSRAAPEVAHTQVVIVHDDDCALRDLERAFARLSTAFAEA